MSNKINFLKFIDKKLGKSLTFLFPEKLNLTQISSDTIKSILVIRPGGIGDAVLLLPAIEAMRMKFPDARIDILCEKRNTDIFGLAKTLNKIYLYDRGLELFKCLRNNYDVVIDTEQWHRLPAVVARMTGTPIRIGFDTNERRNLLTHKIPYSHDSYEVDSFLHLIEPFGVVLESGRSNLPFIDIQSQSLSPSAELKEKDRVVAIFPGASVIERRWGGDRFGAVAKALADKGYSIVLLGSSADKADAELIKKKAADAIDLTGKTDLKQVTAMLGISKLLISADSGLLHIAYAVGTPTVSLFGSGIEKKWAPRGKKHLVINKHLDCSPCTKFGYTPKCRRNVECLASIHVDEVIEAARTILNAP